MDTHAYIPTTILWSEIFTMDVAICVLYTHKMVLYIIIVCCVRTRALHK